MYKNSVTPLFEAQSLECGLLWAGRRNKSKFSCSPRVVLGSSSTGFCNSSWRKLGAYLPYEQGPATPASSKGPASVSTGCLTKCHRLGGMSRLHLWGLGVHGQGASRLGAGEDCLWGGVFSLGAHVEERVRSICEVSFIRPHLLGGGALSWLKSILKALPLNATIFGDWGFNTRILWGQKHSHRSRTDCRC